MSLWISHAYDRPVNRNRHWLFFVLFKNCVSRVSTVRQRPRVSRRDEKCVTCEKENIPVSFLVSTLYKIASPRTRGNSASNRRISKGGKTGGTIFFADLFIDDWPSSYRWRIASCRRKEKQTRKKENNDDTNFCRVCYKGRIYLLSIYPQAAPPPPSLSLSLSLSLPCSVAFTSLRPTVKFRATFREYTTS